MAYPRQISEVNIEWLHTVLTEKKVLTAQQITGFTHAPVPKQGMTSTAHIITLSYDPAPGCAPEKVLAKFSLDHPMVKEALGINRGFEREVAFYHHFGADPGIPVPRCYAAEYDPVDNSCMLLLEYMENTCERDVFSGSPADVELAVGHLAGLHAKWWDQPDALETVYPQQVSFLLDLYIKKLTTALSNMQNLYRDQVGPTLISLLELWLPNAHLLEKHFQQGPKTLCHGDCHRNQFLFPLTETDPFCVIDWQLACQDHGPTDLAQIIVTGLLPEQRREQEVQLVETYHSLLVRQGVTDYSLEQTWTHYKLGMVKLMLFYLCAFEIGDVTPILEYWKTSGLQGASFWEVTCNWPSQALEDNSVIALLQHIVETEKVG